MFLDCNSECPSVNLPFSIFTYVNLRSHQKGGANNSLRQDGTQNVLAVVDAYKTKEITINIRYSIFISLNRLNSPILLFCPKDIYVRSHLSYSV